MIGDIDVGLSVLITVCADGNGCGLDRSSVLLRVMVAVAESPFSLMELWSMVMARVS